MLRIFTPRERDIVKLILQDFNNLEIANTLNLSPKSISTRICYIYIKLGISGKQHPRKLLKEILTQLP